MMFTKINDQKKGINQWIYQANISLKGLTGFKIEALM